MNNENPSDLTDGIAIISLAGRFSKARTVDELWRNIRDGVELIGPCTDEEILASGVNQNALKRSGFVKVEASIEGLDLFDATFFAFTPSEAEVLDPQVRLFIECAWEALETAGYTSDVYKGRIGVYAGVGTNWYGNPVPAARDGKQSNEPTFSIGNQKDFLSTRVSYKLNLKGPSLTVQTACSTSLVTVCLGCQSLLNYQCDLVLAGGVSASPFKGYSYSEGAIYSPDGHCRAFDAKAKGTVPGNGSGVVLLKRLADAIADGDQIHAVIKGFALNNDGSAKIGYAAPSVDGQAEVIAEALAMAGMNPETIGYVETHGTGTSLGDPVEVAALTKVYRASTTKNGYCAIGSIKTNLGHTDTAAGVIGLIKATMSLKHEQIPASLHFEEPNPQIDFANSPFYVNTQLTTWKRAEWPRRAGVSSFGIGGTNAHVVLEEAPVQPQSGPSRPWQLLLLSAKTETALDAMTTNLAAYLKQRPDANLADIAYTLQLGRKVFEHRRMLVAGGVEDAVQILEQPDGKFWTAQQDAAYRPVAFMFPGQGAQYVQMGLGLYQHEPAFRKIIDHCCEIVSQDLGLNLRDLLYPENEHAEEATRMLGQTFITQPALFVVEYATAKLWMEWGVQPEVMVGHSIGEYVAACLSGVLSLKDALRLVVHRGRVMQDLRPGAMLSVSLSEEQARPLLGPGISLAAVNAPSLCVVSGEIEAVEALERRLSEQGVFYRRLHTSHAFHSDMMEPALGPFTEEVRKVKFRPPTIPFLSNVTGTWITEEEATNPAYWAMHLRQTVRFSDAVIELLKDQSRALLEVGPGQTLQVLVKQHSDSAAQRTIVSSLRRPQDQSPDGEFALRGLGQLWLANVRIDWSGYYVGEQRRRVALPTYPFERQRFWIEPRSKSGIEVNHPPAMAGKKPEIADWLYMPSWKQSPPATLQARNKPSAQQPCWLVFLDEDGLGRQIIDRLKQEGLGAIGVMAGDRFAQLNDDLIALNPGKPEEYVALLIHLKEIGKAPNIIAHFWSVIPQTGGHARLKSFEELQELGFYSLLFLAQALGAVASKDAVQIGVVSNNMQDVTGSENRCFEKATLLGPCRVIPQEYPNVSCQSIDIEIPQSTKQRQSLIEHLLAEFGAKSPDTVIAYRANLRWVQTYEPLRLTDERQGAISLRHGGVYLISGGLGGIGITLAGHLAQAAQAKLVLITRSVFPDRQEWQHILDTGSQDDELCDRIRKVLTLEQMGAEVMVFSADVADLEQMRDVISRSREQFGEIHGVIHSAGVPAGGLIQLKTREMIESTFSPKVRGAFVLDSLLGGQQLDFFFVFSSLTSILGGYGQVDYCAANAFLDGFAQSRARGGEALTVSVAWDAWAEVGMAVKAKKIWPSELDQVEAKAQSLFNGAANGVNGVHPLLDELLQEGDEQVFVSRFNPAKQWVLGEHRIYGSPLLVGTAYLEMARAAFENISNGSPLEIKDVVFILPMIVAEGESREVHTTIKRAGHDFEFLIKSRRESGGNGVVDWQEHAMGRIHQTSAKTPRILTPSESPLNTQRIKQRRAEAPKPAGERRMSFSKRWRDPKELRITEDGVWATFELPEEFSSDLERFKLHPALLDVATSSALALLESRSDFYLPFSYGKVTIKAPLSSKIRCYSRQNAESAPDKGVISFDVVVTNDEGIELVEVQNYTMRKVEGMALRGLGEGAAPKTRAMKEGAKKDVSPADKEAILPVEGIEVFRRLLSRFVPSEIIVSTADLRTRIQKAKAATSSAAAERMDKKAQKARPLHPRPSLKTPYVAPGNDLEQEIVNIWQAILGIEKIGIHDNFIELGGHSLLGVQIINRLRDAYQLNIPIDTIFKSPTVTEMAQVLILMLSEQADEESLAQILDELEGLPEDQTWPLPTPEA
jgi:phthiocerol/phenolphthiocerol synthesis type-I polyketide synthase E